MDREIFVYVDLNGIPYFTGRLWTRSVKNKESASFEYDESWLTNKNKFSFDPLLKLGPGPFHTRQGKALFGALGDSAPDRWGRVLMRRIERRQAEEEKRTPRTLQEIDYLLMVDDEARLGALRFATSKGGPFLQMQGKESIPPLIELPRLLSATERYLEEKDTNDDLRLLLAPGTSLGGARPKASVRDKDGSLCIAKFPKKDDEINTVVWEAIALTLAAKAGIEVPMWRVETILDKPILILKRFDRKESERIPFLSAMSMLSAEDNEPRSYLEIVDALRQNGARAKEDMHALYRRIVFNILIANTDDHMRNHGFLHVGGDGWVLSPAYDLNPVPLDIKPRVLSTYITEDDATGDLNIALSVADYFQLTLNEAKNIIEEVQAAVATWRSEASKYGLSRREIERLSSAFEG